MKTILLNSGSRSGSDFFQSLLDGHPQILQFPGIIKTNKKLIKILSSGNGNDISSNFIKIYPHFFDSRLAKAERHYMLGKNKNQYYLVDQEKFKMNFLKMFEKKSKINANNRLYEIILILHQAYSLTCGHDISKKKIMVIHSHLLNWTKYIAEKINSVDCDIIYTVRNPLSAISSTVNHWLAYETGKYFFAKDIYFHLNCVVNDIKLLKKLNKKLFLVQLEMLHKNHSSVMDDFCTIYNLNYNDSMKYSTYFDLEWWGDCVSGKDLNGINENFNISFNERTFYKRDIKFLEYILNDFIIFYGYKFTNKISKIFFNLLPMKCEILTWKNMFKHKKVNLILSIPFFYLKRILLINKFAIKNKYFPYSIGSNKRPQEVSKYQ